MKKTTLTAILTLGYFYLFSQNVAINSTGTAPNASAMLDVQSNNKGILIPRVALTGTNDATTVPSPANWLMVFNTNTAGTGTTAVSPGTYYWDGSKWVRLVGSEDAFAWKITGNDDATSGTHFLGTTNAQALDFRTGNTLRFRVANGDQVHAMALGTAALPFYSWSADPNTGLYSVGADIMGFSTAGAERMRIIANGNVSINNTAPAASDVLTVSATAAARNYAINGYNNQTTGSAVYASNTNAASGYSAIDADHSGTAGSGVLGSYIGTSSGATISGVTGQYLGAAAGIRAGVRGYSGVGAGNQQMGVLGQYNDGGYGIGVYAVGYGGGYVAGNYDFAIVGWSGNNSNYSGYFNGNHVIANGTKSASVGTSKGNQLLYVTELPEVWFEDVGTAQLTNGYCEVKLDPLFLETVFIDETHPMQVFLQEQGESNGLYVVPGSDGFVVKEKNGGTSNIKFSFRIMAKRLHFQDHRFGNDPVWGGGDTRKYSYYAYPPPVDYHENVKFQEEQRKNWKPTPMPEGFEYANPEAASSRRNDLNK